MLRANQESTHCLLCASTTVAHEINTATMMKSDDDLWTFNICGDCSLTYLNPRVKPEQLSNYYDSSYIPYRGPSAWGKYASLVRGDLKKIDSKRVQIVRQYVKTDTASILDVGCGQPSFLSQYIKRRSPALATGIDFTDHGWSDGSYNHIDLQVSAPTDFTTDQRYDVITMWHYLEHEYTPLSTLQHLRSLLKPDGIIIIEVPDGDGETANQYKSQWAGYHTPRHTTIYNPTTLTAMLTKSGYDVLDLQRKGTLDAYSLDWMSRMERQGIDWTQSMESRFWSYVIGKIIRPKYYLKSAGLGFMYAVARVKS